MARRTASKSKEPRAGRPTMPAVYRLAKSKRGMMKWAEVGKQLAGSKNYWICTTRKDGRPHAMPVWGFWIDEHVIFGTGRDTVKARNIVQNPQIVVHLESGDDVVVLECTATEIDVTDSEVRARLDKVSRSKYKMPLMVVPESVLFRAKPRVVLAWREKDFPKSATRWVLD
jgi:hypothetical protein